MIQGVVLGVVAGYGVLSLVGGVMGYVKARSKASLIAGGVSGALLIGSAALAASQPVVGLAIASVVSVALVGRFARSAFASKPSAEGKRKSPVALVMVAGGVAVLVASGIALA